MSGGRAYVLDLDPHIVNPEMVDVAPVPGEELARLRAILDAHRAHTDSAVATRLLSDWPAAQRRFSAIVARDFRRALDATRRARENGEDVDEAVMAAART
jgi:glutamate synthase (NADPH/NADH) large chain